MKTNSGHEKVRSPKAAGRANILLLASVLVLLFLADRSALSAITLAGTARAVVADDATATQAPVVSRGLSSLGLRREAAAYLERMMHLAELSAEEAMPLFEEIVGEQGRWNDPEGLVAICETAIRNGTGTPPVLYSYGTGLRLSGRPADASAIFAQVPQDSAHYPYALFAIGQIAAEEGRGETALTMFRRALEIARERGGAGLLARRAARARAGLLLTLGRSGEAAPLFESLARDGGDPLAEIGRAAAAHGAGSGKEGPWPETIAAMPVRDRILLSLLQGGLARNRGRFDAAIARFERAEEKIRSSLASPAPPVTETFDSHEPVELLRGQAERHRLLRELVQAPGFSADTEVMRERSVELLVQLVIFDHSVGHAVRSMPERAEGPGVAYLSAGEIEEIIRTMEQVTLGGVDVDGLVDGLAGKLDIFRNLAHPIMRYRLLARLERSHAEIRTIKERIRLSRAAAVAGVEAGIVLPMSRLLEELGRFLVELEAIRDAAERLQEFTGRHFNILRKQEEAGGSEEPFHAAVRKALSIDRERFDSLLPAVRMLEDAARTLSWERRKAEIAALRPVVARQMVDALVGEARALRAGGTSGGRREAWAALERAVSYLEGNVLSPRDRVECAIAIASFLEEAEERWESFPGGAAGDKERGVIASVRPILLIEARSGERREEAGYLLAFLGIMTGDPGARSEAGKFVREFSSSPYAGRLAVRLGHEALWAGRWNDAREMYRRASGAPETATAHVARYMLGWLRFQGGDAAGAAGELSRQLSDPGFRCGDLSPFEKAVLALGVRAWREIPLEGLRSYAPVRDETCGGGLLLLALAKDEERHGTAARAAMAYESLAEWFSGHGSALDYERKSVEALIRGGKEDQAFARILLLQDKYGPGTKWAQAQTPPVREKAREELAAMLKSISERKFAEGLRSGERRAMVLAKTGMERFFGAADGNGAGEDAELKLKWAIASLRVDERAAGLAILRELAERGNPPVGEKAAVLYAETTIAAYERREEPGGTAEAAAQLLLATFPSDKAAVLGYRAAAAFLSASEYDRAERLAGEIEKSGAVPQAILDDARLLVAETAIRRDDFAAARDKSETVLGRDPDGLEPERRERATNLFLLASLKEVEARTAAEDWAGAGGRLEELGERFPGAPEAPQYFLRAVRTYRIGGDGERAFRAGLSFLDRFPERKEAVEVVGVVGAHLVERGEPAKAADLYASVAERFPKSGEGPALLFLAARLAGENGDPETAAKRFASYRAGYPNPKWKSAYSTLSIGLYARDRGDAKAGVRELERGIRLMEGGLERDAPRDLFELAGRARIALGEHWAEQFRKLRLVAPLEKNLEIKDRFFRRALALFEKAKEESPVHVAADASRRSGDLFTEFGMAIRGSESPKGLSKAESQMFREALGQRARAFFERALDWYAAALDLLEDEEIPAGPSSAIRERIENVQRLLIEADPARGGG
jgi:hypothetical protein